MNTKNYTTREILDTIKPLVNAKNDSQLANLLGVDRQNIYQYSLKNREELSTKLLSLTLNKIKELELRLQHPSA